MDGPSMEEGAPWQRVGRIWHIQIHPVPIQSLNTPISYLYLNHIPNGKQGISLTMDKHNGSKHFLIFMCQALCAKSLYMDFSPLIFSTTPWRFL